MSSHYAISIIKIITIGISLGIRLQDAIDFQYSLKPWTYIFAYCTS